MTSKAFKTACKNAVYTYVKEHYDAELTKDFKRSDIHVDSFTTHKIPTSDLSDYFTATLSTKLDYKLYILHRPSGIMINWYKHLGRTNTCNSPDFDLDDLRIFLKALKEELIND